NIAVAALLATRPPTHPFAVIEASGLPNRMRVTSTAIKADAAAHNVVLISTSTSADGGAPPNKITPAELSPSHPAHASKQPKTTLPRLCPGIPTGIPSGVYSPPRGPRIQIIDSAVSPPTTLIVLAPPVSRNPLPSP